MTVMAKDTDVGGTPAASLCSDPIEGTALDAAGKPLLCDIVSAPTLLALKIARKARMFLASLGDRGVVMFNS